jgi:hypothetical protein
MAHQKVAGEWKGSKGKHVHKPPYPIYIYIYIYIYEGESDENLKSAIKIRNRARLSCKLTTMILMAFRVADRWQYDAGMQHDGAVVV